tara:strand:- start:245 stop:391 length:147 start_codon:yes stop_codon:yes gene_type:complete
MLSFVLEAIEMPINNSATFTQQFDENGHHWTTVSTGDDTPSEIQFERR